MKRLFALALAMLFVFAAMVGCTPTNAVTSPPATTPADTPAPATPVPTPTPEPTPEPTPAPITIEVAASSYTMSAPMFEELFNGFAAAYPWITVKQTINDKIGDVMAARIASNDAPDISFVGYPGAGDLIKQGKLMGFNELYDEPAFDFKGTVKESLNAGLDEAEMVDGVRYGVPMGPGFCGMAYNVKMFSDNGWAVPTCWEDLLALSPKIIEKGIKPLAWGRDEDNSRIETNVIPALISDVGGYDFMRNLDNLVPGTWGSQQMITVLDRTKEMIDKGVIDKLGLGTTCFDSQLAFLESKYAMCLTGYWFEMEMKDQMKGMEVGFVSFPGNSNGSKQQVNPAWTNGLAAWATDDPARKAAVFNFCRYFVSYEFMKKLNTIGGLPLVANRRVMQEIVTDPKSSFFTKQVAANMADPNVKFFQAKYQMWLVDEMRRPFVGQLAELINGNATPAQIAEFMENKSKETEADKTVSHRKY